MIIIVFGTIFPKLIKCYNSIFVPVTHFKLFIFSKKKYFNFIILKWNIFSLLKIILLCYIMTILLRILFRKKLSLERLSCADSSTIL